MLQKIIDAAMAIGNSIKETFNSGVSYITGSSSQPAIEGEYLGKGGIDQSRRSFFSRSSMFVVFTACLVMLPSLAMAAVPAAVDTAITEAATDVATVGAAVLGVFILIKVFKWIGRTF